jgi:hypothetical protein
MSKYGQYQSKPVKPKRRELHPVWRGVGFVLMIVTPLISYAGSLVLLSENAKKGWVAIPAELISPFSDPMLFVKTILTLALTLVVYAIFGLLTALLYDILAPSPYGPTDVPPTAFHGKRYKR